ncbi:MAG: hypothetical protein JNK60_03725 [Acidobacteria bacterium]|nr:hypothetical protein [Acidobacteriota bacterium]
MSRGLLIGLAGSTVCGLVAVAFLLGRLSGRNAPLAVPPGAAPIPAPTGEARHVPVPAASPTPYQFSQSPDTGPRPAGSVVELGPTFAAVPAPTVPPPAARGDASVETTRAEVARYLDAVDNLGAGKIGEGEGVANEMAAALVRGDTSGLDRMIRDTEGARAKLAALVPPSVCATHHRESLGSIDDALEMLGALKTAMQSPDPAVQLASVAGRATELRTRAEAVQREEQSLRQRYGIPR